MNWQDIINNYELVYASVAEDKGFITWSLKKTTCNVEFYDTFIIDNIDQIVCSIVNKNDGIIEEERLATILGFNVIDDFSVIPKRYADNAELEIFKSIVKPVFDWGLIKKEIDDDNSTYLKLTILGEIALNSGIKYKFNSGTKILFENFGIKPMVSNNNKYFPFYSALGISSEIENIKQIPYENIKVDEIFSIEETDLIKCHKLQSENQYFIYKSNTTLDFKIESCDVDIRLYKQGVDYYPIIFNNNIICYEATELLNDAENAENAEKKVEWGLYLQLIKDPTAILNFQSIIPFEDLLDLDTLIKDNRLVWSDELLFHFIAKNADANQWYSISNHCPIDIIKMNIQRYSDKLDWNLISIRIDDDFLIQNAKLFPWNFEAISAKEDISIEVLKTLLLIPELKEQEWDWDNIMPQLDYEFIKANIESIDFELSALTKANNVDIRNLIALYPERRWDWAYISNEYDLPFILSHILNFKSFINLKIIINRAFISEDDIDLFCSSDNFRKVLLFAKNTTLKDYSPNQSKYIWTDQLISLLETTGFLIWESGRYTSGFECNSFVDWNFDFFNKHHLKITTQKGFDFISAQISDTQIINEYPDFQWNWEIISSNPNLISDSNFLLSVKDKLNFRFLLPNISGSILETIFEQAGILSFLEANEDLWFDVTEKSSKEFVLQHIDYNWDWTILTSRFYSTIKIDALGNPKWINKWDWIFLTQNLDLNIIAVQLDQYLERWDWTYLTRKLEKEFVLDNLPEYNEYWCWEVLLNERFSKHDLLLSNHLAEVATCVYIFDNEKRVDLWKIITSKFEYNELIELIAETFYNKIFQWDYNYFYSLPEFDLRRYLIDNLEYVSWLHLSCSNGLNIALSWDNTIFSFEVWIKDVLNLLNNPLYKWDYKSLSRIENINWNDTILKVQTELWDWEYLSKYSKCFKKANDFLPRFRYFSKYINFPIFSERLDTGIGENLLTEFIDRDWDWAALSSNSSLLISISFITKHKDKPWDWKAISTRDDIELNNKILIELSNKDWDWKSISYRSDIKFSEDLIEKLYNKPLDWYSITKNNTFIPNAKTLTMLKGCTLNWDEISNNENIEVDILWDYKDYLNWEYLTKNKSFNISNTSLLIKYKDYIDWNFISESKSFEISFDNLKQFRTYLNWESINRRIDLNISEDLLQEFTNKLNWSNVSKSMQICFTEEMIEKYSTYWDWQSLRKNPQIIERLHTTLRKYEAEFNSINFLERFQHGTPYIYHFTHLFNAIDIIKSRKILSRHKAEGHFSNSAGNLVARRSTAHDFARFYFRPQTPTQFYNECLGLDSQSGYLKTWKYWDGHWIHCSKWKTYYPQARNLGLPKCPIPVFFKFELKEVMMKMLDKCFYSTGNMQTNWAKIVKVSENPYLINTMHLYSTVSDFENYKQYSQQEFLVEEEFDFSALDSFEIICYNEEYANLLKSQIGNDPICKKVSSDSWDIFHRDNRELYINETDTEISISSAYRDNAYLSIQGQGLNDIQVLNPDNIQKETANEILAYPEIRFTKTNQPIEVRFVDLAIGKREWLIYKN